MQDEILRFLETNRGRRFASRDICLALNKRSTQITKPLFQLVKFRMVLVKVYKSRKIRNGRQMKHYWVE